MASKPGDLRIPGTKARMCVPSVRGWPACCPGGARCRGGVSSSRALAWNRRTCRPDTAGRVRLAWPGEGEPQAAADPAPHDGVDFLARAGQVRAAAAVEVPGPDLLACCLLRLGADGRVEAGEVASAAQRLAAPEGVAEEMPTSAFPRELPDKHLCEARDQLRARPCRCPPTYRLGRRARRVPYRVSGPGTGLAHA